MSFIDRILIRSMLIPGDYIKIFQSVVDAYQKQLGAIGITVRVHACPVRVLHSPSRTSSFPLKAGLFGTVMISLAQMVQTIGNESAPWKALRIFMYGSISANLVAAGNAIWATIYLAWMPLNAAVEDKRREPTKVERAEVEQRYSRYDDTYRRANIRVRRSANFSLQYTAAVAWYGIGLILTFPAIGAWVLLTLSLTEKIVILVLVGYGVLPMIWPLLRGVYLTGFLDEDPWMIKRHGRV
jgi:hypothetical protein